MIADKVPIFVGGGANFLPYYGQVENESAELGRMRFSESAENLLGVRWESAENPLRVRWESAENPLEVGGETSQNHQIFWALRAKRSQSPLS